MVKSTQFQKRLRQKKIFYWALITLPLLNFLVFYVILNINSILLAFRTYEPETGQFVGFSFENFNLAVYRLFNDPGFKYAFINSFKVYFISMIISTPLTQLFSFYMYKKMRFYKGFKIMLFMPVLIPGIALVLIFKFFTERAYPAIVEMITGVAGVKGLLQDVNTTLATVLFFSIWSGFGMGVLMYAGAMDAIDDSVVESAKLDGATTIQEYLHITFPLIYPTFTTFMVASVAGIFSNQINLFSFFGTSAEMNLSTFGYYLYQQVHVISTTGYPFLSAIGLMLTIIAVPITLVIKYVLEKYGFSED